MSPAPDEKLVRTRTFTEDDFRRFAAVSGDHNPIHLDPAFAARTRFGRPVAHGMLLLAVLDGLCRELLPGVRVSGHDLRFPAPTFAGEEMRFELWPAGPDQVAFSVSRAADGAVACDGALLLKTEAVT